MIGQLYEWYYDELLGWCRASMNHEIITESFAEHQAIQDEFSNYENQELLEKLPKEERVLFVLRYFEGYNSTELGEMFSLPPGTVRARLSSARKS